MMRSLEQKKKKKFDDTFDQVIHAVRFFKEKPFTASELAKVINISRNHAGSWLQRMKRCYVVKLLPMKGSFQNGYQKQWRFVSIDETMLRTFFYRYGKHG